MIRIFIADDHDIVRDGLKSVISKFNDMEVVGEAGTGESAVAGCAGRRPDVLILDLNMPGKGGIDIIEELRASNPEIRILIFTMHDNEEYAIRAMRSGAMGYILKGSPHGELPDAIRKVYNREKYVADSIKEKIAQRSFEAGGDNPLLSLSHRELQVMKRIALGKNMSNIADELCLSVNTIGSYKRRVREKLGFNSNEDLIRFSREHGVV